MKTIAILIQTGDDKKDLRKLADELSGACNFYLEGNKMLDSWRTPFTIVLNCGSTTAIGYLMELEDKK